MDVFNYVMVLASIIIGLAITHLLQGVAGIVQHPKRARVYWVHLVWVVSVFLGAVFWWWWEFRLSTQIWSFQLYVFVLLYAVIIYLRAALLFPADLEGYVEYKDYFYSRRGWFLGLGASQVVIDVIDTLLKGTAYFRSLSVGYPILMGVLVLAFTVGAFTRNERFHAVLPIGLIVYQLYVALTFYDTAQ